jgi:hypothetical protein
MWVLMCVGTNRLNSAGGVAILKEVLEIHTQGGVSELMGVFSNDLGVFTHAGYRYVPQISGPHKLGVPPVDSLGNKKLDVK